jgi:hypothetical protein
MAFIFIGTPMYAGMCTGLYTQSLINTIFACSNKGHEISYGLTSNQSLITHARNTLVHSFLKTNATHLMFIDADMRFSGQDVLQMLEADKDIICAVCPKKEIDWENVASAVKKGVPFNELNRHSGSFTACLTNKETKITVPTYESLEVDACGTGFMLIKRHVFDTLKPLCPKFIEGKPGEEEWETKYFDTSINPETNKLLSEDYHFCYIWRKTGGKVYVAPWLKIAHVGTYVFDGELTEG